MFSGNTRLMEFITDISGTTRNYPRKGAGDQQIKNNEEVKFAVGEQFKRHATRLFDKVVFVEHT